MPKPSKPRPANAGAGSQKKKNPGGTAPKGKQADSAARIEAFCLAYHANPNGKAAAIQAAYSPRTAEATASRLLRTSKVVDRLKELAALHASEKIADGRERRELLTRILRDEVKDVATGGKELEWIHTPVAVSERTRAIIELAKMDGDYAAVKIDVKVTEYSRDWLKQALVVIGRHVDEDTLRNIAVELPRFDP